MTATVLLVGHGSREAAGNEEIVRFAEMWRARHPGLRVELCFIELAAPLLAEGLDRAAAGSDTVNVIPLVLNAAGHVKMEIPEAIEEARQRYPGVQFAYARHLGMGAPVLEIFRARLCRARAELDHPDPQTTGVILLGRGSSDAAANGEMAKMARWLFEKTDHELVDIAFTGITWPRLETVVARMVRLGQTQIAILPAYLFTGVLLQRIARQVARLRQQYPQIALALGEPIGFDEGILALVDTRLAEVAGEVATAAADCDGCPYRAAAAHDHAHHHHHHEHAH